MVEVTIKNKIDWRENITKKLPHNLIPQSGSQILQKAIANAYRHGIGTKPGKLNPATGDCSFESVLNNINYRNCFKKKLNEATNKYRLEWVTQLEKVQKQIGCIDTDRYRTIDWDKLKRPGTYTTEISDLALVAIAKGCHKDILIFNTSVEAHGPIYVISAGEYTGWRK